MDDSALHALAKLEASLKSRDVFALKSLAGQCAAEALQREDQQFVELTVLAYSFAKFLEKYYVVDSAEWASFYKKAIALLEEARKAVEEGDTEAYHEKVAALEREIEGLHKSLGKFVVTVVEKARIKAATQIYAHGASLSKAAAMAKASRREVASYIGATHLPEKYRTIPVKRRLELAEQYFAE